MPRVSVSLVFELLTIAGSALILFKLLKTRLSKRYHVFFWYFIYRVIATPAVIFLPRSSGAYMYFWTGTMLISWIFYILIVRELFGLVLARHPGIATLGRWFMYLGTAVSLAISILSMMPQLTPATPQSKNLHYILGADRGITFSLVVFQLLVLVLLSRYPVRLARNVVVHTILFSIYFLSQTVTGLMKSVFGLKVYANVDTVLQGVSAACGFAWYFLLSQKGEEVALNLQHKDTGREKRLMSQLDSLNETLLKAGKN